MNKQLSNKANALPVKDEVFIYEEDIIEQTLSLMEDPEDLVYNAWLRRGHVIAECTTKTNIKGLTPDGNS